MDALILVVSGKAEISALDVTKVPLMEKIATSPAGTELPKTQQPHICTPESKR